jgi:hypothetical protein
VFARKFLRHGSEGRFGVLASSWTTAFALLVLRLAWRLIVDGDWTFD